MEKVKKINYKFSEDQIIEDLKKYVDSTYGEHYASNNEEDKIQTVDYIMSQFEDGTDFLRGNALKYLARYGLKDGKNKKDLLKAFHYIIFMLHFNHKGQ